MKPPLRTLLVGVGTRGKHWARLLNDHPGTNPVGYVDLVQDNLTWARSTYGADASNCFVSLEEALTKTEPDLVVLATPPMGHLREAHAVFAAGCDLLAEKPLTIEFDESIEIVRAAEAAGRKLVVGLNFRYLPVTIKAKELFANELGRPSFARFDYWRNRDGRRPGINKYPLTMRQPMLYEQSLHHLDLFRFAYDAEVVRVWSRGHNPPWSMYRDDATVMALLEMTDDLLVNYCGTWSGQTKVNEFMWRTDCENGSLFQHELFSDLRVAHSNTTSQERIALPEIENFIDDTRALLADVVKQLAEGAMLPHPSGIDHLKTMALTVACDESSASGHPVEMAEFYVRHNVPEHWL